MGEVSDVVFSSITSVLAIEFGVGDLAIQTLWLLLSLCFCVLLPQ